MTRACIAVFLVLIQCTFASAAIEKWADDALPVKDNLALWIDATRQIAAWEANGKGLIGGSLVDVVYDGSGRQRDFVQAMRDAQPRFFDAKKQAAIRFDGKDDSLRTSQSGTAMPSQATVFVVASPRTNKGGFRAFLSATETGKSDWATGFNVDLGPEPARDTFGVGMLNVEGPGFTGVKNLAAGLFPMTFDDFHVIAINIGMPGKDAVSVSIDGNAASKRDRTPPAEMHIDEITLGARCFSNEDTPPYLQGFFDGDIAEVILYERVLSAEERKTVESYLLKKHENAADAINRPPGKGHALKTIEKPPAVQMFAPGFVARELPLDLTNINNVRYREDGKLVALGYDGRIWILSDSDGDGLEDKAELFFDGREKLTAPLGLAVTPPNYPRGRGVFVPCKSKLALIVDTDGDDKADKEITVAEGWQLTFQPLDAMGVALDKENNVYFGLGCSSFLDPYLRDKDGVAHYDPKNEHGTIMKVSSDFSKRESLCTGVRFSVGLAFNKLGDLFCTDQEGATWCPNGNPFDELLHIQQGRHYGFPPRHPKFNPTVIDEPSTFDLAPQHQSACGLLFNDNAVPFGPKSWEGDAIVCGESRGKLYRTQLFKTETGYVARTQLLGSLPALTIDSCVSPKGDLVVTTHSGNPDWGTGPAGKGKLYKITYAAKDLPQPVLCYPAGQGEVRIAFDRPTDPAMLKDWSSKSTIEFGQYVSAGDRFETMRPGYAAVKRQMRELRESLSIGSVQVTPDGRTIILSTSPQRSAVSYALTVPGFNHHPAGKGEIEQINAIDLAYDLSGVEAEWKSSDGKESWRGWLPHPDLSVSRALTTGSAEHDRFWALIAAKGKPGTLTLRCSLDLHDMLHPAIQPGAQLDWTPAQETVKLIVHCSAGNKELSFTPKPGELAPFEMSIATGETESALTVTFTTNESPTPRPLALRRFLLPWAKLPSESDVEALASAEPIPQLKGGDWLRGREVFFGNEAACYKCHTVRGRGSDLGPDLSNLIHRDYESVMRDIANPSGALNPDYIASIVRLKDGQVLSGIVRNVDADHFIVRGDAMGEKSPIARSDVKKIMPSPLSVMPSDIPKGLGEAKMRDLLTFLLTEPLTPAKIERKDAPLPGRKREVEAILKQSTPTVSSKPLRLLLVASAKDHGPSEHDYPMWQQRWTTLLGLAEHVSVTQATDWPTSEQWNRCDVAVFYSSNANWSAEKAKDLDAFQSRGGGLVFLHMAVNAPRDPEALAKHIGLAWQGGTSKFRHGPVELTIDSSSPITHGLPDRLRFIDETYWKLLGDVKRVHVLASAPEEGEPRPLIWTMERDTSRVFVCILGHYTWTFDDPLFRAMVLRGIAWSANEQPDRLLPLATIGARLSN